MMSRKSIAEKVSEVLGLKHLLPKGTWAHNENTVAIEILLEQVRSNSMEIRQLKQKVETLEKKPCEHVSAPVYGPGGNNYGRG
jgi:hypothetical protein